MDTLLLTSEIENSDLKLINISGKNALKKDGKATLASTENFRQIFNFTKNMASEFSKLNAFIVNSLIARYLKWRSD